jgi:hypothetical protein
MFVFKTKKFKICGFLLHYCKATLGVHKKATNFAVLSELGRFPLYYQVIKAMLNYWFRLEMLHPSFVLLKEAYSVSKSLFDHNKPSWFESIQKLLDKLQCFRNMDLSKQTPYSFKKKKVIINY